MPDYHDQPAARLENDSLILDYLTEAGPRIVRLIPKALGENLLAETPDYDLPTPYGRYRLWGGHRLWHAPEAAARTYVPDEGNLRVATAANEVSLARDEPITGIRKELTITMSRDAARVHLIHRLTNTGLWPVELAPWAITQLRLGGTALLPTTGPAGDEGLLPDRLFALWPYSRWDDPRFRPGEEAIEIVTQPIARPFKLGYLNHAGWLAYRYGGVTFTKRWTPRPAQRHVDFGCNAEVYTNDRHLELETLGPLVRLSPGESVEHVEAWEVGATDSN
ncbi:MAG: hypothetical protein KIS95_09240 [Anaerolineae bacterium]|uniref:hypothetical protein n=1 Tax=Promineifilum sp. TaxID=2664178 RepID=UPI001D8D5B30|nr:hypothetical protein [Anaerolineales bacterium]MCB8935820.1 hypothetical protein [Promineifilum sp.]MCO5180443.1 hypothetical protein [Promineifilum sp.]MCW5847401.1 hypothetical protein [Anaerolineae bacterium]